MNFLNFIFHAAKQLLPYEMISMCFYPSLVMKIRYLFHHRLNEHATFMSYFTALAILHNDIALTPFLPSLKHGSFMKMLNYYGTMIMT